MHNMYSEEELAAQLPLDLAEGESWHIEFKAYDHTQLDVKKVADGWKDDLSDELAAFGSIGGKIYIGISDDGTIRGIDGSHQIWQEKLLERAVGRVKPKVNWKSYYFTEPTSGLHLIRIDVLVGEPIYYVMNRPYIREGTTSRPAEPEEVKARFKEYFATREPILITERERPHDDTQEQTATISWVANVLMNILSSLNLYEQKDVNPHLDSLKIDLQNSRSFIESNLNKIKRMLGEQSAYYRGLELISHEILAATKVRFFMDGGISRAEWLSHLKKVHDTASDLLSTIRSSTPITIEDLNEQEEDTRDATIRWFNSIDDYSLNKFVYEANRYVHMLLRLYFLLWLSNDEQKANQYKEFADEIEKLSWARTNTDYQKIQQMIPELKRRLHTIS